MLVILEISTLDFHKNKEYIMYHAPLITFNNIDEEIRKLNYNIPLLIMMKSILHCV